MIHRTRKASVIAGILLLLSLMTASQVTAQRVLNDTALMQDYRLLGDVIAGIAPKLDDKGRKRIDSLVADRAQLLKGTSMSVLEFLDFIRDTKWESKFDEHASFSIKPEDLAPYVSSGLFPIPIYIIDNDVFVNTDQAAIPYGSQVHAINGVPIDTILHAITDSVSSFDRERLIHRFSYSYMLEYPGSDSFVVAYNTPSEPHEVISKSVVGVDIRSIAEHLDSTRLYRVDEQRIEHLIDTEYDAETKTYYLHLKSFSWDGGESKSHLFDFLRSEYRLYDRLFRSKFREMNKLGAQHLIIDIRNNGGGYVRIPALLLSYMVDEPFDEAAELTIPDLEFPHIDHIVQVHDHPVKSPKKANKHFKRLAKRMVPYENGYRRQYMPQSTRMPKKETFNGNIYLLVGGQSASASSYFTALFKQYGVGVIVGQQLGGSHHDITAGTFVTYQLPHTKIKVRTPLLVVRFDESLYEAVPEEKITPVHQPTREAYYTHFMNKSDAELNLVRAMIQVGGR